MPLILTSRTPWRRRPSGLVEIDRSSPLCTGLLCAQRLPNATLPRNAVDSAALTFAGSPSVPSGVAPEPNALYGSAFSRGAAQRLMGTWAPSQWTFLAWVRLGATSVIFSAGYNNDEKIDVSSGGTVTGNIRLGAGSYANPTGPSTIAWNSTYLVALRYDRVNATIWMNGVSGTPVAETRATEWGYSTDTFSFPGSYLTGYAWDALFYGRALSDAEIYALYAPDTRWSMYAPLVSRRYFDLGGAGGPSDLVCDAGAYTVTGHDATLTRARLLTCDAGSYSLTGQDASLTLARVLTADAGAYTLTGQDATLTRARVLTTEAGAYTLSGQEATLTAARAIALDAGSYSLTGHDATLTKGVALVADAGSYTVTGYDATLTWARALSVDAGSYTLTGQDASLAKIAAGTLDCDAGAYTLTGYDATLTWARVLPLDAGGYTVTGQEVTFTAGAALVCDAGSYGVTGYDVDLWWAHVLSADAGAYSLTGQAATVSYSGEVVQVADAERTWQAAPRDTTWRAKVRDTTWRGRRR